MSPRSAHRSASRTATLAGGVAVAAVLSAALAAPALAVCDAYSGGCTEPPGVLPTSQTRGSTTTGVDSAVDTAGMTPSTLPFTGGELVLLSVAGASAVAGGVALVVVGRRRQHAA